MYAKSLTQLDTNALLVMKEDSSFDIFSEVIEMMLENGIKLEQEIVAYGM